MEIGPEGTQRKVSVFLSHNSEDKPLVRKIGNELRQLGARVWIDEAEIKLGESLIEKISEGVFNADFLLVCLSKKSVDSEWVKREVNIALTQEIRGKKLKVIPLMLEDCATPMFLLDKKYADFTPRANHIDSIRLLAKDIGLPENRDETNFLRSFAFYDLVKRNSHFDVESIDHFDYNDFLIAKTRLAYFGIKIQGIEAFTPEGDFFDVDVSDGDNPDYVEDFLDKYRGNDLLFSASYNIPDEVISLFIRGQKK